MSDDEVVHPCPACRGTGWYKARVPSQSDGTERKPMQCWPCNGTGKDRRYHFVDELTIEPDTDEDDEEPWEDM